MGLTYYACRWAGCMIRSGIVMAARPPRNNSLGSLSFSLVGLVGVLALVMAGATIWLRADRSGDGC